MIAIFLMVSTSSTTKQSLGKIEQRAPAEKVDVHLYNFFPHIAQTAKHKRLAAEMCQILRMLTVWSETV